MLGDYEVHGPDRKLYRWELDDQDQEQLKPVCEAFHLVRPTGSCGHMTDDEWEAFMDGIRQIWTTP